MKIEAKPAAKILEAAVEKINQGSIEKMDRLVRAEIDRWQE